MRKALVYLPGIDGTGRLLYRQRRLFDEYEVSCVAYPQDRMTTYDELANLGIAALENTPGRHPGVVVAESFGGGVALTLALRRPDLVERLVLVNTFAFFPRRPFIEMLALVGPLLPAARTPPVARGLRGRFFFAADVSQSEQEEWWKLTGDVPLAAYGRRFAQIAGLDLREELKHIDIPAVVFVAPNDPIVPPSAGRDLARRLPRARLVELPVGHPALVHPRVDVAEWIAGL
jgi:pimeloyl-ACP methyl ester carboxylesterase